jgi:hypothetical protein
MLLRSAMAATAGIGSTLFAAGVAAGLGLGVLAAGTAYVGCKAMRRRAAWREDASAGTDEKPAAGTFAAAD